MLSPPLVAISIPSSRLVAPDQCSGTLLHTFPAIFTAAMALSVAASPPAAPMTAPPPLPAPTHVATDKLVPAGGDPSPSARCGRPTTPPLACGRGRGPLPPWWPNTTPSACCCNVREEEERKESEMGEGRKKIGWRRSLQMVPTPQSDLASQRGQNCHV